MPEPGGADEAANDDNSTILAEVDWAANRLAVAQMVFGKGFASPGGAEVAISLIQPLGLNASSNVLEIGSEMGGSTRAIASHSGAYVTGMEFDREFAEEAVRQARGGELEKKAAVETFDPETLDLREGRYAGIVLRNTLCRIEERRPFFLALAKSLKSGGQVIIRDLFLADASHHSAYQQWHGDGQGAIYPPDVDSVTADLNSTGMDIRIVDDVTERYCSDLLQSWNKVLPLFESKRPSSDIFTVIEEEAETWSRRLTLLRSGALTVNHVVGVHP